MQRTNVLDFSTNEKYVCSSAPPRASRSSTAVRKRLGVDGWVKLDYDVDVWYI